MTITEPCHFSIMSVTADGEDECWTKTKKRDQHWTLTEAIDEAATLLEEGLAVKVTLWDEERDEAGLTLKSVNQCYSARLFRIVG